MRQQQDALCFYLLVTDSVSTAGTGLFFWQVGASSRSCLNISKTQESNRSAHTNMQAPSLSGGQVPLAFTALVE